MDVKRTTYTPKDTTKVQGTQQTGGPKGKAAAKPASGGEKADSNQAVKDVANISTAQSTNAVATTVQLFGAVVGPMAPVITPLASVVVMTSAVEQLPGAERMQQAAEEIAKAVIEAMQKHMSQPPEIK